MSPTRFISGEDVIAALGRLDETDGQPEEMLEARTRIDWEGCLPHVGKVAGVMMRDGVWDVEGEPVVTLDYALAQAISGFAMGLWAAGEIFAEEEASQS